MYSKLQLQRKKLSLCIQCGNTTTNNLILCETHYAAAKERSKTWAKNNREKSLAVKKQNYQRTRDHQRDLNYKRAYGITMEDKWNMLREQEFLCPICSSDINFADHVDHNKITGEVREVLCENCNRMLGIAQERILTLSNAITYLEKHEVRK